MLRNERGIAFITTLVLGFIALLFIGSLIYMLTTGSKMSGTSKVYQTALEAAKGGVYLITTKILAGETLKCNNGNNCTPCPSSETPACKIDLDISNLDTYNIEAYLLSKEDAYTYTVYSFRVKAYGQNADEKAIIEFVYKVQ